MAEKGSGGGGGVIFLNAFEGELKHFSANRVGTKTVSYQENFAISKLCLLLIIHMKTDIFLNRSIDNTRCERA